LFHRAISMAGTVISPWARCRDPLRTAQKQAKLVNCSIANTSTLVACLRNTDPVQLVKTYPMVSRLLPLQYTVPARHRFVVCVSIFPPHTILSWCLYIFCAYNEHDLDIFERLFVLNSNLEWDTDYPDWSFLFFFSVTTDKCREYTTIMPWPLPFLSFPIHGTLIILQFHDIFLTINNLVKYTTNKWINKYKHLLVY
jgi:hypothetical protein